MRFIAALIFIILATSLGSNPSSWATEPNWSISAKIGPNGRSNPYEWDSNTLNEKIKLGQEAILHYPVTVTGFLMPARPLLKVLDLKPGDPFFGFIKTLFSLGGEEFKNFHGFWDWMGLTPSSTPESPYPLGLTFMKRKGVNGLTFGCAACHSSEWSGKQILGMTTRFSRANSLFIHGKLAVDSTPPELFRLMTNATAGELALYEETRSKMQSIGLKMPSALGLDTSLAQVALSLARRAETLDADRSNENAKHPRENLLDHLVADSKPAVWWNLKYKNRWLSDGSVIAGNPVFTNFLWNEIGRGADLPELARWLKDNEETVQNLTTAVFATQAPRYQDFFGAESISLVRAKRGEMLYQKNCSHCHGTYQKAWSLNENDFQNLKNTKPTLTLIDTLQTRYLETTPVINVGTDAGRRVGMQALEAALNPLRFSQEHHLVIQAQKGYVPPPLDGIWIRYPYFHNNSIPNLCALMTAPEKRPITYYSGKAIHPDSDYDSDCVGYPLGNKTPLDWKKDEEHLYDTRKPGLSNVGHFKNIFTQDGKERYSEEEKKDLREYLKTL